MRFYILVSGNLWSFEQSLKTLPNDRTQVVINTMVEDNVQRIINCCDFYGFSYVITESDGTPATGKNAMLKVFLDSDDEYAMCIDGDDIVSPTGVKYYTELADNPRAPDVLALYKQVTVTWVDISQLTEDMLVRDFPENWRARYPMVKTTHDIYLMTEKQIHRYLEMQYKGEPDDELLKLWAKERYKFQQMMNQYSEDFEYMNRLVWYSRKAAEMVKFGNELTIGEDTVQFMKLKRLAQERKLRMFRKIDGEDIPPTYISNQREVGITKPNVLNFDWVIPLNRKLESMIENDEMPMPNVRLPDFT